MKEQKQKHWNNPIWNIVVLEEVSELWFMCMHHQMKWRRRRGSDEIRRKRRGTNLLKKMETIHEYRID